MSIRKKIGDVETSHTENIIDGKARDKKEMEYEERFIDFCEVAGHKIERIPRPKGNKSDAYDFIDEDGDTIDVKGHWVSKTQHGKDEYADETVFIGKFEQGLIAIQTPDELRQNLRYNGKVCAFYLLPEYYEQIENYGVYWDKGEDVK